MTPDAGIETPPRVPGGRGAAQGINLARAAVGDPAAAVDAGSLDDDAVLDLRVGLG